MQNKALPVIECAYLEASDFAQHGAVIVKTGKASNFRVEYQDRGFYIVYGRAEFLGGSTVVRGIEGVRQLLITR